MRQSLLLLGILLFAGSAQAAEKWVEPSFTPPESLVLWLDAGRQQTAYEAHGRRLAPGANLDVWYDGSGQGAHLVQRVQGMQPRFDEAGGLGLVRFQGKESLGRVGRFEPLQDFTLFLVTVPRANRGGFQALMAFSELGKNDYVTGMTVDQSVWSSAAFSQFNIEGRGFGGVVNLMKQSLPFGALRLVRVEGRHGPEGIKLFVDGKEQGHRSRDEGAVRAEAITLGARYYAASAQPPHVHGFFDGDMAEVMLFRRALSADEAGRVEAYLRGRYALLVKELAAGAVPLSHLLQQVANPPTVQMLLPGFTVKELPVQLPDINNIRYRHDGKLVALGYNGNVYLLSDKDGDGLEDTVEVFWDNKTKMRAPIGMQLTPKGYAKGQGLFVASKGRVSLIVDTDGDDRADKEIIVAQDWKEIPHGVDALGVALDPEGNLYFGLGAANFTDAYQVKNGKSHFDITSERGTIQKVSPDFKKRETVCTGIRFPVGMAFNRLGDLFCTDQEGATWLANGNPLDELLHIQPGRHYGFPPRHPRHLPQVIDEPSVFDYGPQHQSTCGLFFNESVNGGPVFGRASWAGDALVCGESRGKLYRTQLVKTAEGYVAQNHILARLQMLTIDACVSPKGEVVLACHSGAPDWGTGPQGKGKLFKVFFNEPKTPLPVLAWSSGPGEVRIAFDRPLAAEHLRDLAKNVKIEKGAYLRAGDRFETLKPPYDVVKRQGATPRFDVSVLGAQVTPDRRTLVLATSHAAEAVHYAVTLLGLGREKAVPPELPQSAAIDVGYSLSGVQAQWQGQKERWSGWLPHLNLDVSKAFTVASAEHDALWKHLKEPGELLLRTRLNLWQMLRPAVQEGSTLDFVDPPEQVTVHVNIAAPGVRILQAPSSMEKASYESSTKFSFICTPKEKETIPLEFALATGQALPHVQVWYSTNEDKRPRALQVHRFLMPWATLRKDAIAKKQQAPELQGGNWANGKALFFGEKALCASCHQVNKQGGMIGPDLSNLIHRDYESVLRDIRFPSAALNPDYIAHLVSLKDGRALTGTLRTQGDKIWVGTTEGKEVVIARDDVETLNPLAVSVMPEGLDKKLSPDELRDLLTFLLTEPLEPAPVKREGAPPPRKKAEVDAILKMAKLPKGELRKIRIVLAAGPKDHGLDEHDYPLWQRRWVNLLSMAKNVQVSEAFGWPSPKQWQTADLIVFYSAHFGWSGEKAKDLDAFLERGGGLVYIHWAVAGHRDAKVLAERIGLASGAGLKFRHGPLEITIKGDHPITRGFDKIRFVDESYWNMIGDPGKINVLGTSVEDKEARPQIWTVEKGRGRIFVMIPGHYTWTFDDPLFRVLTLRGMAWAAHEAVDRWVNLATVGARIEE